MFYELAKEFSACPNAVEILKTDDSIAQLRRLFILRQDWANWARWNIPLAEWRKYPEAARVLWETNPNLILIGFSKIWSLAGIDLSGSNLERANLSEADIERANLSGSDIEGANLYRANLSEADIERANLSSSNLEGANLSGSNLERANLSGSNLEGANLERAKLEGANLSGSNLEGANLDRAHLSWANFERAKRPEDDLNEWGWKADENGYLKKSMLKS